MEKKGKGKGKGKDTTRDFTILKKPCSYLESAYL